MLTNLSRKSGYECTISPSRTGISRTPSRLHVVESALRPRSVPWEQFQTSNDTRPGTSGSPWFTRSRSRPIQISSLAVVANRIRSRRVLTGLELGCGRLQMVWSRVVSIPSRPQAGPTEQQNSRRAELELGQSVPSGFGPILNNRTGP
jgi:hypothetical protein